MLRKPTHTIIHPTLLGLRNGPGRRRVPTLNPTDKAFLPTVDSGILKGGESKGEGREPRGTLGNIGEHWGVLSYLPKFA